MAFERIRYDIIHDTRELDQENNLFYFERILLDTNTNSVDVTITIEIGTSTIALSSANNAARGVLEFAINRIGPLNSVEIAPFVGVDLYSINLVARPIRLGLKVLGVGQRVELPGRTSAVGTSITFDVNPFSFPEDARHISPVLKRLYIDAQGTFTPTLDFDDGTTSSLTAFSSVTRTITEYALLQSKRLKSIRLVGDFSAAAQVLYDIEIDTYIPNTRQLAIG